MNRTDAVHAPSDYPNRAYCGTSNPANVNREWVHVTCTSCQAAHRADMGARG